MHVSTSYCNTDKKIIEEKVYPRQADWREIIHMVENVDEQTLLILQPKYVYDFPRAC